MGVNHEKYDAAKHNIISNASCTTNCLAPVVHVLLKEGFGIDEGLMTTVHSYTATQKTVDGPSQEGLEGRPQRRASTSSRRTTGAAKAVALVLPGGEGQADRHGVPRADADRLGRRPDRARPTKETSYKEICAAMKKASETYLKGILGYTEDEVVSSDFIHDAALEHLRRRQRHRAEQRASSSSCSWYDNEWGYSNRCVDLLKYMVKKG